MGPRRRGVAHAAAATPARESAGAAERGGSPTPAGPAEAGSETVSKRSGASRGLSRAASFIISLDATNPISTETWKTTLVVLTREGQLTVYDLDRVRFATR